MKVRKLEAQGLPTKHAEAITSAVTEVLNDSLQNVAQSFVSKEEMQKVEFLFSFLLFKLLFVGVGWIVDVCVFCFLGSSERTVAGCQSLQVQIASPKFTSMVFYDIFHVFIFIFKLCII